MAEGGEGPTLGQIDKNPLVTATNEDQRFGIAASGLAASTIQESSDRMEKQMTRAGYPQSIAKRFAQNPIDPAATALMDKVTSDALNAGADEYAIMSAIHSGTAEGHERAKHNPLYNYLHDWADFVKSRLNKGK